MRRRDLAHPQLSYRRNDIKPTPLFGLLVCGFRGRSLGFGFTRVSDPGLAVSLQPNRRPTLHGHVLIYIEFAFTGRFDFCGQFFSCFRPGLSAPLIPVAVYYLCLTDILIFLRLLFFVNSIASRYNLYFLARFTRKISVKVKSTSDKTKVALQIFSISFIGLPL